MYGIHNFAEAEDMVKDAAKALAAAALEAAEDPFRGDDTKLAAMANKVSFWRGYATVYARYERIVKDCDGDGDTGIERALRLQTILSNILVAGPDDNFGSRDRGNDARRAAFDGAREAVQELTFSIRESIQADA